MTTPTEATAEENSLNTKFRSAISHALLGADCEASKDTWELVFGECEKIAKSHAAQRLSEMKEKAGDNLPHRFVEIVYSNTKLNNEQSHKVAQQLISEIAELIEEVRDE